MKLNDLPLLKMKQKKKKSIIIQWLWASYKLCLYSLFVFTSQMLDNSTATIEIENIKKLVDETENSGWGISYICVVRLFVSFRGKVTCGFWFEPVCSGCRQI